MEKQTRFVSAGMATVLCAGVWLVGCAPEPSGTASSGSQPPIPEASDHGASARQGHAGMNHGETASTGGSGMTMSHAMGTKSMDSLRAKMGADFDKAFLSQMIAHHAAAVEMAQQALKSAKQPQTQADAKKVIASQTEEIARMKEILKVGYNSAPNTTEQARMRDDMRGMMAMPVTTDRMFYEMMIPHHQGAVTMSELAGKNAGRDEVKQIARQILDAQKAEISEYKARLATDL